MLKKPYYTRPSPGAPRRVPSRPLFSHRSELQRAPPGKEPVSAGSGRAGEAYGSALRSAAAAAREGARSRRAWGREGVMVGFFEHSDLYADVSAADQSAADGHC